MNRRLRPDLRRILPTARRITWRMSPMRLELQPAVVPVEPTIRSAWLRFSDAERPKLGAHHRG